MKIYIFALLLLTGCYNAKKAQKHVNKALLEYPDKVATIARDAFPCITTASDTVTITDTLLDFIDCPEAPGPEYVRDTVIISGVKTVTVKVPGKTQVKTVTVTQRIEDSAKIKLYLSVIADRDQQIESNKATILKQDKKISRKNKELWVHRSLWFLLILYGCYRIWRNLTTIKVR